MKPEFQAAIDDPENPVLDINAAGDGVLSMLLDDPEEGRKFVDGSIENIMLYIHSMDDFLTGERGARISQDPELLVQKTQGTSVYRLTYDGRSVESMPSQAGDVLQALRAAKEDGDSGPLMDVYGEIIDSQVRRDVVNTLLDALPNLDTDRIEKSEQGWLIDGYYVVDWTASLYVEDDPGETYERGGGGVETIDKSKEFIQIMPETTLERTKITLDGEDITLGEREMLFLTKAQWVLKRTEYHPDESFWRYTERQRKEYLRGETEPENQPTSEEA